MSSIIYCRKKMYNICFMVNYCHATSVPGFWHTHFMRRMFLKTQLLALPVPLPNLYLAQWVNWQQRTQEMNKPLTTVEEKKQVWRLLWWFGLVEFWILECFNKSCFLLGKVHRMNYQWNLVGDCKRKIRDIGKFLASVGFRQAGYSTWSKTLNPVFLHSFWIPPIGCQPLVIKPPIFQIFLGWNFQYKIYESNSYTSS